jgi:hypothetical protein
MGKNQAANRSAKAFFLASVLIPDIFRGHFLSGAVTVTVPDDSGSTHCRRKEVTMPVFGSAVRLCGLVIRVSGYRSRGLGFDSRHYQII